MRALALAVLLVLVAAPAAAAHGATDNRARITSPPPAGVDVALRTGGRIEVTNRTAAEVVVLGFQGEPYLRIAPTTVDENRRSPAGYLNRNETPPDGPATPPDWHRVGDGPTYTWHDHRVHWMAAGHPPAGGYPWSLDLVVGGQPTQVRGLIAYTAGPSPWPWYALGVLAAVIAALAPWIALVALVVLDVVRVLGLVSRTGLVFDVLGWVLAAYALARRDVIAAALAGLGLAIAGGYLELGDIGYSQLAITGSDAVARACIVLVAGAGTGVAATAAWRAAR